MISNKNQLKFGHDLTNFLSYINVAFATLSIDEIVINGNKKESEVVRYNFSPTIQSYQKTLFNEYTLSVEEIEFSLREIHAKFDKLYFISTLINELYFIKNLFILNSSGSYTHFLFNFSNTTKDKKKKLVDDDFQGFYKWQIIYIDKMINFALNLKEIIQTTNQSDFPLPLSLIKKPNDSTIESPIEFFKYLFDRNGIFILKKEFIPSEDDYYYRDIKYDPNSESYTEYFQDNETGEIEKTTRKFSDYLTNILVREFFFSKKLIDNKINFLENEQSIILFIKLLLLNLEHLEKSIKSNKNIYRYDISIKSIFSLKNYVIEKYFPFIPIEFKNLNISSEKKLLNTQINQSFSLNNKKKYTSFQWKPKSATPNDLSTNLWQSLKKHQFIGSEVVLENFKKVFDGSENEHPLKIKWIAKARNKNTNKVLLIFLFEHLSDKDLVDENYTNALFLKKLSCCFCDEKSEPFKNLEESNATTDIKVTNNLTPQKKIVLEIIENLVLLNNGSIK